jgi:uncharacterized protein (TIGR02246 family)
MSRCCRTFLIASRRCSRTSPSEELKSATIARSEKPALRWVLFAISARGNAMLKRLVVLVSCLVVLFLLSVTVAAQQPSNPDAEATAIKQTLTSCSHAFKSRDARAAAMCFTEDADFTGPAGVSVHGRKEIEQLFEKSFARRLSDANREYTVKKIRFFSPQIAAVEDEWKIAGSQASGSPLTPYAGVHTLVVIKEKGNWRIVVFHGSRFRPRE